MCQKFLISLTELDLFLLPNFHIHVKLMTDIPALLSLVLNFSLTTYKEIPRKNYCNDPSLNDFGWEYEIRNEVI